jgi:hypothetical protein
VKLVVPVRLYPGAAGEAALRDTLTLCNQAAGLVSAQALLTYTLPGTAAFFLIGALADGSPWADRTIKTSLLQAPPGPKSPSARR